MSHRSNRIGMAWCEIQKQQGVDRSRHIFLHREQSHVYIHAELDPLLRITPWCSVSYFAHCSKRHFGSCGLIVTSGKSTFRLRKDIRGSIRAGPHGWNSRVGGSYSPPLFTRGKIVSLIFLQACLQPAHWAVAGLPPLAMTRWPSTGDNLFQMLLQTL